MSKQKRILVFTGDGKGKTTAAMGMALRAAGHGMNVRIIQFLKNDASTGELAAMQKLEHVVISQHGLGFVPKSGDPKFTCHRQAAHDALKTAIDAISQEKFQLVVLDEACCAVSLKLIEEHELLDLIAATPKETSLVLTGRGATDAIIAAADTVTEMQCVKHGYNSGMKAARGVEF